MAGGYNPWYETPSFQPESKDIKIQKCKDKIQKCKDKIQKWTERLNAITVPASPHDHRTSTAGDYF